MSANRIALILAKMNDNRNMREKLERLGYTVETKKNEKGWCVRVVHSVTGWGYKASGASLNTAFTRALQAVQS